MAEAQIVTGDGGGADAESVTTAPPQKASQSPEGSISWSASEFVSHHKTTGWYAVLAGGAVVAAALVYIFTRDVISTAVVIIAALAFAVIAARQPRQLQYQLNNAGLVIGQKQMTYNVFKSFAVVREGAFSSIIFRPLRRFAPLTTIYYAPEDEDRIIQLISTHLPFEEYTPDPVDNVLRRIRF